MAACGERPDDVNAAGKDAEDVSVAGRDVDQFVVWEDGCVEEDEEAVFGCFGGGDIAAETPESRAKGAAGLAEEPPLTGVFLRVFGAALLAFAFRLDVIHDVLIDRRESGAYFLGGEAEQVDHHYAAWPGGDVTAIAVVADMAFEARDRAI